MSCENYTRLNNVSSIGQNFLIEQLEDNLKSFFDWGLLNIGGFVNIKTPTTGINNNLPHQLKPTNDPSFTDGRVWQISRKDIVWETGVNFNGYNPVPVSGININNAHYPAPTGSGSIGYHINYPLGRVIFDKPLTNSNVSMEYSYRWCQIHKSSSSLWWTELQGDLTNPNPQFLQKNKGDFNISANHRVQMPCIIIEPISRSSSTPWQLGGTDFMIDQDILLHIFTERAADKNTLADIIRLQKHKTIWLYDIKKVVNSGVNGLNYKGSINSSGKIYPDLVMDPNFRWYKCFFKDINIMDMETSNSSLFWCTIRLTAEVII
jgi:hypothetical protein